MVTVDGVAETKIIWPRAHRIIHSRYPPIYLFEDIADPVDWELIASAQAKTNPRFRQEVGDISLVPPGRRVSGPGSTVVMAPFTHFSRDRPTRFSNGNYGIYYAGDRFEVALKETVHHHERFMRATEEPESYEDFREYVGAVDHRFHDLRGKVNFVSTPTIIRPHRIWARVFEMRAAMASSIQVFAILKAMRWQLSGPTLSAFRSKVGTFNIIGTESA